MKFVRFAKRHHKTPNFTEKISISRFFLREEKKKVSSDTKKWKFFFSYHIAFKSSKYRKYQVQMKYLIKY